MPTVRRAKIADAEALGRVHVLGWQHGYAGQLPEEFLRGLSVSQRAQRWRELLADPALTSVTLIASTPEIVLGFAGYGPSRDEDTGPETGELYAMYVDPAHWRTGAGRLLHQHAMRGLSEAGYTAAMLWMLRGNERAHHFYTALGWAPEGSRRTEHLPDGPALPEVRYRRQVS